MNYVYFIVDGGFVKIGRCAGNPMNRMAELQCGNPRPLTLAGVIPEGTARLEAELHLRFNRDYVQGEWFTLSRDIRVFIATHAQAAPRRKKQTALAIERRQRRRLAALGLASR